MYIQTRVRGVSADVYFHQIYCHHQIDQTEKYSVSEYILAFVFNKPSTWLLIIPC